MRRTKITILLLCILAGFLPAWGAEYYVSTTGSDSNSGTINAPWATVAYGLTQLSPGDTLNLRGELITRLVFR